MMRQRLRWAALAAVVLAFGCDDGRSRVEAGEDGRRDLGAGPDAGSPPPDEGLAADSGRGPDAADALDAETPDAMQADAEPPDLHLADSATPDSATPDSATPDSALAPDLGEPDGSMLEGRFVVGQARAADGMSPVTVRAGDIIARVGEDDRFRIGPLPAGELELRFLAPDHQSETVLVELDDAPAEVELQDEMFLYRGVRVGPAATGRMYFRFDEGWFAWQIEDTLVGTPVDEIDLRTLVAEQFEVFLGFDRPGEGVYVRRRNRPGLAGDIERVPLDGGPAELLFVEAQPWVREIAGRVLAMVETREALSRLVSNTPGGEALELGAQVPWLLVTTLADDAVAWVGGPPDAFEVFVGAADGGAPQRVSPPGAEATSSFLLTTPDRRGLVWHTSGGTLWRWPGDGPAEVVAEDALATPRPRLLRDGRVMFARASAEAGRVDFHVWTPEGEIDVIDAVRPSPALVLGEILYVQRPGAGLWRAPLDGIGPRAVLDEPIDAVTSSRGGVLALRGGVAWRYDDANGVEQLGGEGLTSMQFAPLGATAWQAERGALWFIPGPGLPGPAAELVVGAPAIGRINAPGGSAIYALGPDGWLTIPIPPDGLPPVAFDRPFESLTSLGDRGLLGIDPDTSLWRIDPNTGISVGWARNVTRIDRSSRNGMVGYVCDRGTFLVPVPE